MSRETERDENGLRPDDWRWMRWEIEKFDLWCRWSALKAMWCKPVTRQKFTGVRTIAGRGEDWTFWRGVKATVAIVLDRRWSDDLEARHRAKRGGRSYGDTVAFWDAHDTYHGHECMIVQLYPGCRVELFSDGD